MAPTQPPEKTMSKKPSGGGAAVSVAGTEGAGSWAQICVLAASIHPRAIHFTHLNLAFRIKFDSPV